MARRTESFLTPKKVLPESQYERYKEARIAEKQRALRERTYATEEKNKLARLAAVERAKYQLSEKQKERIRKQQAKLAARPYRQQAYATSTTGRISGAIGRALQIGSRRGGVTRALYGQAPPSPFASMLGGPTYSPAPRGIGRRGRPKGAYASQYAAYGGVYEYRKAMSHKRQMERLQAQQAAAITPEQQQALAQIRARQQAAQVAPENQIIPDTTGKISMRRYMQEIDEYAGLVD